MATNIQKDQIRLSALAQEFGPKIALLSRRMIRNRAAAEEAAQEAWCQILSGLESFEGRSSVGTWIFTVARRTIARYARRERVYTAAEFDDFFSRPEIEYRGDPADRVNWVWESCDDCLTAFCHCLGSDDRLIFIFREMIGLSYPELSAVMDMDEINVRKRLSRSRKKVGNFMDGNCLIYNPEGECRCRIRHEVRRAGLDEAFKTIEKTARLVRFFEKAERLLPRKEFWKKNILNCHE